MTETANSNQNMTLYFFGKYDVYALTWVTL